jgi:hypothetical protein
VPAEGIWTSTEFTSAIIGSVVGTVGGGIISFLLQRSALNAAAQQRNADRKEAQSTTAHSVITKTLVIHTTSRLFKITSKDPLSGLPRMDSREAQPRSSNLWRILQRLFISAQRRWRCS